MEEKKKKRKEKKKKKQHLEKLSPFMRTEQPEWSSKVWLDKARVPPPTLIYDNLNPPQKKR